MFQNKKLVIVFFVAILITSSVVGLILTNENLRELLFKQQPSQATLRDITAKALDDHECDNEEWHFVITQVESESKAPGSIRVEWANGDKAVLSLQKFTGGTAHYASKENLTSKVTSATAQIYSSWSGQFNLSHGPCGGTVSTPTPSPTARPSATGSVRPSSSPTARPSSTVSASSTPRPSATARPSATVVASTTPGPSTSASSTPQPSTNATATPVPTATPAITTAPTATPNVTATPAPTTTGQGPTPTPGVDNRSVANANSETLPNAGIPTTLAMVGSGSLSLIIGYVHFIK
jgi:hypothetical protein